MLDLDMEKLGQTVAAEIEEPTPEDLLVEQRAFMTAVQQKTSSKRYLVYGVVAAAASLLIALLVTQLGDSKEAVMPPPTVVTQQVIGHQVIRQQMGEEVIQFDGGSEFVLDVGASAKVVSSFAKEVVVELEEGALQCSINGNGHTRWIVRAGAWEVLVTGTQFFVHFEPEALYLNVVVSKGSVLVTGDTLDSHGIKLAAGKSMSVEDAEVTISNNVAVEEVPVAAAVDQGKSKAHKSRKFLSRPKKNLSLQEQIDTLSYDALWHFGSKLRYEGRHQDAYAALTGLRSRFPGKPYAKQATFLLGRISLESRKNPAEAQRWFENYLKTSPHGRLAEQSMGRLIHICRKSGNSCASGYANQYLAKYPNGAFAELAQSVLE